MWIEFLVFEYGLNVGLWWGWPWHGLDLTVIESSFEISFDIGVKDEPSNCGEAFDNWWYICFLNTTLSGPNFSIMEINSLETFPFIIYKKKNFTNVSKYQREKTLKIYTLN